MTELHNYIAKSQSDELDGALDAALAKYAAVEPRGGLEGRILANLQAQPSAIDNRSWQRWTFAAAALALVVFALALAWRSTRGRAQIEHEKTATIPRQPQPEPQHTDVSVVAPVATARVMRGHAPVRRRSPVVVASMPKLDQFPSPQPLSDEERALARYAAHFPLEARVIAQAQEEYARESQQLMRISASEIRPSGSDQQER